ncbi:recombination-associated protein RdgC [Gilvimarinus sp. 1_MG-2023]|uniref:recombination-associated protein RdgC n=1 Tax=Gilvimarinus sp. 1_MG-2023 TaxID=3062638 RepID=UPI0026E2A702|nr:recombination-associated protein RdgC [Gilvimarinus sp. 1_MG-2023]MDO6747201.1 recombination-associated protein RdgC [Gilvimarinus sp. 1_MG-2023]
MLFKNAFIYTFPRVPLITEDAIAAAQAKPCGPQEMMRVGFVKPAWSYTYVLEESGYLLLCLNAEEKILPPAVINKHTDEKVRNVEETEGRKVLSKERALIKDEVTFELLPKAFTKNRRTYAIFDTVNHFLIVDQASPNKAEEFCSALRDAVGSLEVTPIRCGESPDVVMTAWVDQESTVFMPGQLRFGSCAKLKHPNEGPSYAIQDDDLEGEHVQGLIQSGLGIVEVELKSEHQFNFTLTDGFILKGLHYSDSLISESYEQAGEDGDLFALARSDLLINGRTISDTVKLLSEAFGGAITGQLDFDEPNDDREPTPEDWRRAVQNAAAAAKASQAELKEVEQKYGANSEDPLYPEGVKFVREKDRATISGLQRGLRIGYNRAARMIEQMESDGIVSAMDDTGTRVVYQDDSAA